jgi:hypothetical protein
VVAPTGAAFALARSGVEPLFAIAIALTTLAAITFVLVPVPNVRSDEPPQGLYRELTLGLRWVSARPGLLALLGLLALTNTVIGAAEVLVTPIALGFTSAVALGYVLSLGATGVVFGSLLAMRSGGEPKPIRAVLVGCAAVGAFCLLGSVRPSLPLVAMGVFGAFVSLPIIAAASESIWQASVPPAVHGRVFAFRAFATRLPVPFVHLGIGALTDRVLAPLLNQSGALTTTLGRVVGTGPGRASALALALMGGLLLLGALGARRSAPVLALVPPHGRTGSSPRPSLIADEKTP